MTTSKQEVGHDSKAVNLVHAELQGSRKEIRAGEYTKDLHDFGSDPNASRNNGLRNRLFAHPVTAGDGGRQ